MDLIIIERHFKLILEHCRDNYPAEAGGFLGGTGNLILGVFPVPNFAFIEFKEKHEFGIAEADCLRANQFFEEYKMDVLGFYHSHPSSPMPIPSRQDVIAQAARSLRVMMVISLADLKDVNAATFEVMGSSLKELPLKIIPDEDINKYLLELDIEKQKQNYQLEAQKLEKRVQEILKHHS